MLSLSHKKWQNCVIEFWYHLEGHSTEQILYIESCVYQLYSLVLARTVVLMRLSGYENEWFLFFWTNKTVRHAIIECFIYQYCYLFRPFFFKVVPSQLIQYLGWSSIIVRECDHSSSLDASECGVVFRKVTISDVLTYLPLVRSCCHFYDSVRVEIKCHI